MEQANTISGQDLREMFATATNWLEKSASDIDALNVFPVPDGDTGTNMLLTMRSTIEETDRVRNHNNVSAVAQAMAKGALMGARGNSGVILSQFWSGLAKGLAEKETCNGGDLADALLGEGLDAFAVEPPVAGDPLLQLPQVIATPHLGAQTDGATSNMGWFAMRDCLAVLRGENPKYRVA